MHRSNNDSNQGHEPEYDREKALASLGVTFNADGAAMVPTATIAMMLGLLGLRVANEYQQGNVTAEWLEEFTAQFAIVSASLNQPDDDVLNEETSKLLEILDRSGLKKDNPYGT